MTTHEHRQLPLPGYDSLESMRQYFFPTEDLEDINDGFYVLTPIKFADAVEHAIESITFRESIFNSQVWFDTKDSETDASNKSTGAAVTISTKQSINQQSLSLVSAVAKTDRGPTDFGSNPEIEAAGSLSVKEFEQAHPGVWQDYLDRTRTIMASEDEVIEKAADTFYSSYPSLARVALCHMWDRHITENTAT